MWHSHCPRVWPVWAQRWATTKGSLTKRLVGLGRGFEVQVLGQGAVCVRNGPSLPPSSKGGGVMRQRLVRLMVEGQAVVFAQTLLGGNGLVNDWHFWNGLGQQSLGSKLFTDPLVRRGPLFFARLPAKHPWVVQVLRGAQLDALWLNQRQHARIWYARCARFERKPCQTPLWVMEVFLPALERFV